MAPRPLLVTEPSGVLASGGGSDGPGGTRTDKQAWEQALAEVLAHTSPISDVRASREYRRAMLPVLTRRVLAVATERQAGRGP